jgi:predicted cupin superfamily sugar epimerase
MTSRSSGAHRGQEPSRGVRSPTAGSSRTPRAHSSPARPAVAERLDLWQHPEGGWYRRTWTSPATTEAGRQAATAILFLLTRGERSAPHVVDADELWLWHGPGTLTLLVGGARTLLGPEQPQVLVPAGVVQSTEPVDDEVLVSCVVSPGFEWSGFRLD